MTSTVNARTLFILALVASTTLASAPAAVAAECHNDGPGGLGGEGGWTYAVVGAAVATVHCRYGDLREIPGKVLP